MSGSSSLPLRHPALLRLVFGGGCFLFEINLKQVALLTRLGLPIMCRESSQARIEAFLC